MSQQRCTARMIKLNAFKLGIEVNNDSSVPLENSYQKTNKQKRSSVVSVREKIIFSIVRFKSP